MTDELTQYQQDYDAWAVRSVSSTLCAMARSTDAEALRIWRACSEHKRRLMWADADEAMKERIRRMADESPAT